jgi:peptidoglycan/LPS O-acetylase OafA/YrhL
MDAIALGCFTALFVTRRRYTRRILLTTGVAGAALMIFILGFSVRVNSWGIGRAGLDMTIVALGTCLVIVAAAQSQWRSPRIFAPFLSLGQRSYEVYLTHMFVVFGFFRLFLLAGKPMRAIPALFITVILFAVLLGELVARFYSEPMNRWLRKRLGDGPEMLGSVIEAQRETVRTENSVAV